MKLPNADQAIIDPTKFTDYALNPEHDDGKHKAALFRNLLGITADNLDVLMEALRDAAVGREVELGRADRYGQRYILDFEFVGPDGKARLRSAWIVRTGEVVPRLVTCYII